MSSNTSIRIFIALVDGQILPAITVNTSDSIFDLKRRIYELKGFPVESQILKDLNITLDNNRSVESCKFEDNKTLFLLQSDSSNPSPKELKTLFFKDLKGRSLTLSNVPLSTTVKELRQRIVDDVKFDVVKETLRFQWAGKQWEDDRTLEDYGVYDNATVFLLARLPGGI